MKHNATARIKTVIGERYDVDLHGNVDFTHFKIVKDKKYYIFIEHTGEFDATIETVFELADNYNNLAHTSFDVIIAGDVKHLNLALKSMIDRYQFIGGKNILWVHYTIDGKKYSYPFKLKFE